MHYLNNIFDWEAHKEPKKELFEYDFDDGTGIADPFAKIVKHKGNELMCQSTRISNSRYASFNYNSFSMAMLLSTKSTGNGQIVEFL